MMTKHLSEIKELNEQGEGQAVLARLNAPDLDGDVLLPGAIGRQVCAMMPAHDWKDTPIGKVWIHEGQRSYRRFQNEFENQGGSKFVFSTPVRHCLGSF